MSKVSNLEHRHSARREHRRPAITGPFVSKESCHASESKVSSVELRHSAHQDEHVGSSLKKEDVFKRDFYLSDFCCDTFGFWFLFSFGFYFPLQQDLYLFGVDNKRIPSF